MHTTRICAGLALPGLALLTLAVAAPAATAQQRELTFCEARAVGCGQLWD